MARFKPYIRAAASLFMVFIGALHFIKPADFVRIVPAALPAPLLLVYVSGVAEIAGGIGLQIPRLRKWAAYGLILLYICVFPANVNMAMHNLQPEGVAIPVALLWCRLPFQALFIYIAWWLRKD
jgi:uncharacterized membrane protein